MPNHEDNHVVVIGKVENIRRFIAEAFVHPGQPFEPASVEFTDVNEKDFPVLNFNLILPQPENIERGGCGGGAVAGVHMDTGEVCWYTWNNDHWGTKWGAYNHEHFNERYLMDSGNGVYGRVDLRFQTAWSQPTPVLEAIQDRWDLVVHAVTQDEGGFPDTVFGSPYDEEVIRKITNFDFEVWDQQVAPPAEVSTDGN